MSGPTIDTLRDEIVAARERLAVLEDQWRKAHVGYMRVDQNSASPSYRRIFLRLEECENGGAYWNRRSEEYDGPDALARIAADAAEADPETIEHVRVERIAPLLAHEQADFDVALAAVRKVVSARMADQGAFDDAMTQVEELIGQRSTAEQFLAEWGGGLKNDVVARFTSSQSERTLAIERLVDALRAMARADHERLLDHRRSTMTELEREEDAWCDHPLCACGLILVVPGRRCYALADLLERARATWDLTRNR